MSVFCAFDNDFFEGLEGFECVSRQPEGEDVEVDVGECVPNMAFSPFSQKYVPVVTFEEIKGWIASHQKNQN